MSPQNTKETGRLADGRFAPGTSGNPGGRPKSEQRVIELAREQTETAIETLVAIAGDEAAPASARVSAAIHLLDRAWGRPRQAVEYSGPEDHQRTSIQVRLVPPE